MPSASVTTILSRSLSGLDDQGADAVYLLATCVVSAR